MHHLRAEFCIRVTGEVRQRPAGNENPELPTGEIEVVAGSVEVLSEADPLPFPVEGSADVSEDVRIKYRYLDIRREEMARALHVRSSAAYLLNDVMRDHRFVNVETPYLTRSTPEGARDFLVPCALPRQLVRAAAVPAAVQAAPDGGRARRYYQLARCFRDEDFRKDRQPEFTQIDLEMSFVTREDVIAVAEDIVGTLWSEITGYEVPRPLPRMTYADAMSCFGSDKPDLRFGAELVDLSEYFAGTEFRVFQAPYVGAVVMPGGASQTRREFDAWQDWAKSGPRCQGAWITLSTPPASVLGPSRRSLRAERAGLATAGAVARRRRLLRGGRRAGVPGTLGGPAEDRPRHGLSRVRGVLVGGRLPVVREEPTREAGHPSIIPSPHRCTNGPKLALRTGGRAADAYDIVNGYEFGGGTIRIHHSSMHSVFAVLGCRRSRRSSLRLPARRIQVWRAAARGHRLGHRPRR